MADLLEELANVGNIGFEEKVQDLFDYLYSSNEPQLTGTVYVGNVPHGTTGIELREFFNAQKARVLRDGHKTYAFVDLRPNVTLAPKYEFNGRVLNIGPAHHLSRCDRQKKRHTENYHW